MLPAVPRPVGRGILTRPPECFNLSARAFLTSSRPQLWCQTGRPSPRMHRTTLDLWPSLRSPRSHATYTIRHMSMFTASPCSRAGRTLYGEERIRGSGGEEMMRGGGEDQEMMRGGREDEESGTGGGEEEERT